MEIPKRISYAVTVGGLAVVTTFLSGCTEAKSTPTPVFKPRPVPSKVTPVTSLIQVNGTCENVPTPEGNSVICHDQGEQKPETGDYVFPMYGSTYRIDETRYVAQGLSLRSNELLLVSAHILSNNIIDFDLKITRLPDARLLNSFKTQQDQIAFVNSLIPEDQWTVDFTSPTGVLVDTSVRVRWENWKLKRLDWNGISASRS